MRHVVWLGAALMLANLVSVPSPAQTKQEHVHAAAGGVMPFNMSKALHIFKMTDTGGVQTVVAREPVTSDQVALIRMHLRHEAAMFEKGNYSDPSGLHGADMPGLTDLQKGGARVRVSYAELANGAEITFKTEDLHLLTAIHRWFGAQLSEHGSDARAE